MNVYCCFREKISTLHYNIVNLDVSILHCYNIYAFDNKNIEMYTVILPCFGLLCGSILSA